LGTNGQASGHLSDPALKNQGRSYIYWGQNNDTPAFISNAGIHMPNCLDQTSTFPRENSALHRASYQACPDHYLSMAARRQLRGCKSCLGPSRTACNRPCSAATRSTLSCYQVWRCPSRHSQSKIPELTAMPSKIQTPRSANPQRCLCRGIVGGRRGGGGGIRLDANPAPAVKLRSMTRLLNAQNAAQ
jgi:hypothetical protein